MTGLFSGKRPPERVSEPVLIQVDTPAGPAQISIVRHARATRLRLSEKRDGSGFRLTLPLRYPIARASDWAQQQGDWIAKRLQSGSASSIQIEPGVAFPYRGRMIMVAWDAALPRQPRIEGDQIILGGPRDNVGRRIVRFLKEQALTLLTEESLAIAHDGGLRVTRVSVADPKSRWGSCAHDGHIRYSWRLILMPDRVRRATVAHEVAHLHHMHHGPEFHALVDQLYGQSVASERRWLKREGASVQRYDFG